MNYKNILTSEKTRKIFYLINRVRKWNINGFFPNIPKFIVIIIPHTSLLDFWTMLNVRILSQLDIYVKNREKVRRNVYWLAKKSLFKWPIKKILYKLGSVPVERKKSNKVIINLVNIASKNKTFVIGIAPDGTRKATKKIDFKWRTGFYYLALKANIPVITCYINNNVKTVHISKHFFLTGNESVDYLRIKKFINFVSKIKH